MTALPRFSSRAFLAPMAGVSDPALRLLCRQRGAGLVVTEFTSIHSIVARAGSPGHEGVPVSEFLEYSEAERPLSVQLFGSDVHVLEAAARIVEPYFDMIDYNMGCPAPHITSQMAGGALLQEAALTRQIFETLVGAVRKPVTLKMRAGMDPDTRHLFMAVAKIAEDCGIQMITLHPRTVSQGYSGLADRALIGELKQACSVPIVGNGDIATPEDAKAMLDETGCDYIMVGRGAMGNPFLFEQINDYLDTGRYKRYQIRDRLDAFMEYMELTRHFSIKFSQIKGQAMRFTRGVTGGARLRSKITLAKDMAELESVMMSARTSA